MLLTLDESTYLPRDWAMGADHPIAWEHEFDGGRAWYTQGGHTTESYSEPLFLGHLLGGIQYALAAKDVRPRRRRFWPSLRDRDAHGPEPARLRPLRVADCSPCKAIARRPLEDASTLRIAKGIATGTSAALPPGRWQVRVYAIEIDQARSVERARCACPRRRARRGTPAGRAAAAT